MGRAPSETCVTLKSPANAEISDSAYFSIAQPHQRLQKLLIFGTPVNEESIRKVRQRPRHQIRRKGYRLL